MKLIILCIIFIIVSGISIAFFGFLKPGLIMKKKKNGKKKINIVKLIGFSTLIGFSITIVALLILSILRKKPKKHSKHMEGILEELEIQDQLLDSDEDDVYPKNITLKNGKSIQIVIDPQKSDKNRKEKLNRILEELEVQDQLLDDNE